MTNNNIVPQIGDLLIYGRVTSKGNSSTKVGPVSKVINKRDGSKEVKVRAFNSVVNSPVSYDNLIPVVAYVDQAYLNSLVEEGYDLQVVMPAPVEEVAEMSTEDTSMEDCGCPTEACEMPEAQLSMMV